ncbi:MAG: helix-turn-helix domain-containing protein [Candidatus Melainabacteria bacterium]
MPNLNVTYTNRLKDLMLRAGFRSVRVLSEETGISQNTLFAFIHGKNDLTVPNLIKVLWALDCTFEDLVQYEVVSDEPTHVDDLSDEIKEAIQRARQEYPPNRNIADAG